MKAHALRRNEAVDRFADVDEAIYRIKSCSEETEVAALLHSLIQQFGAESYVFINLSHDRLNRENYRYLIGCSPKWCQLYNAKKWSAIDPFIRYSLHNSTPVLGSAIQPESSGQRELLEAAAVNGFRSGMVIPAHAGSQSRIGVLYVGSMKPPTQAEPVLMRNRNYLRAIALELFEWTEAKLNAEIIARFQFDSFDIDLLKLERQGFTADDAASMLGSTAAIVNHRFLRINEKLEVRHKKDAAEKAVELGILRGFA